LDGILIILYQLKYTTNLRLFKAGVPRKSDFRFKPDFGFCLALFDMNMNRFVTFVRPKREAISSIALGIAG